LSCTRSTQGGGVHAAQILENDGAEAAGVGDLGLRAFGDRGGSERLDNDIAGQRGGEALSAQLSLYVDTLQRPQTLEMRRRLCDLAADLLQLTGEVYFDRDSYTDAARCYNLSVTASRESGGHNLWACALTRQADTSLYDRDFASAASILDVAVHVARRGNGALATRPWIAAVQADAFAGLGNAVDCARSLDSAETVAAGTPYRGWIRFDGSRLAEERGTCLLALGLVDRAETALTEAAASSLTVRRRAAVLVDLAAVAAHRLDLEQFAAHSQEALAAAQQLGSHGVIGRKLTDLMGRIGPLAADPRVADVAAAIAEFRSAPPPTEGFAHV